MEDFKEAQQPFWKRRHIIALHGFFMNFLLGAYRISMSVAIVAMVDFSDHENQTNYPSYNTSAIVEPAPSHEQISNIAQYDWSPKVQGYILGASFFGCVFSLILGATLAESFGPKTILLIGTFVASFSTTVTPFAASVHPYFVVVIQFIRGVAQGFFYPAAAVLSANWFPSCERGLLSGLSLSGHFFGFLVTGIVSSLICDSKSIGGWPVVFYTFGGLGIFVSFFQMISLTSLPKDDSKISQAELKYILENQENKLTLKRPAVPWRKIMCSMPTYALFFAIFGQYWLGNHFLSVHATFLATVRHYPITKNGVLVSTPYILTTICNLFSSFLSSSLTAKNYLSISKIRKLWNFVGCFLYSICLALMLFTNSENIVTIICSIIGIGSVGFISSGIMLVPLDMAPTFSGSLMGLSVTVGSLAGFMLPVVCGFLTNEEQTIKQWNNFFIVSIVIVMSSAIFFCIFGSAEIQSYNSSIQDSSPKTAEEAKKDFTSTELKEF